MCHVWYMSLIYAGLLKYWLPRTNEGYAISIMQPNRHYFSWWLIHFKEGLRHE